MHMQTLGTLDSSRITGTTCCAEGTGLIHTVDRVSVSVATSFLCTGLSSLTETGDGNTLALTLIGARCRQLNDWFAGVGMDMVNGVVIALGQELKATRSDPDTCRLIVWEGTDISTGFVSNVPTNGIQPGHHGFPICCGHGGSVVTVGPVTIHGSGPGLVPEVFLTVCGTTFGNWRWGVTGHYSGRNQQITPEHVTTTHGSIDGIIIKHKRYRTCIRNRNRSNRITGGRVIVRIG
jgi:hypothetical protein